MSDQYPFIGCRSDHIYEGRRAHLRVLVVHDMEAPYGVDTAENVAHWMAGANAPKASANFFVDANSVVQGVRVTDTAWHTPNINSRSVGIEHAGYARETEAQWLSEDPMLNLSAALAAELCRGLWIPARWLTIEQLRDPLQLEMGGITCHVDCTRALGPHAGHTDPGAGFPRDLYLDKVRWFMPHAATPHYR